MLKKIERFGAKPISLPSDELIKCLNTLEASVGPIPESYRAYLLHFGASFLFNINIIFKELQPSTWSGEQGNNTLESLYGLAFCKLENLFFKRTGKILLFLRFFYCSNFGKVLNRHAINSLSIFLAR